MGVVEARSGLERGMERQMKGTGRGSGEIEAQEGLEGERERGREEGVCVMWHAIRSLLAYRSLSTFVDSAP